MSYTTTRLAAFVQRRLRVEHLARARVGAHVPDADVASQRAGDGGGPREDLALVSSRGVCALRVQDVPPEADLGGDEQPERASRLGDEAVHRRALARARFCAVEPAVGSV